MQAKIALHLMCFYTGHGVKKYNIDTGSLTFRVAYSVLNFEFSPENLDNWYKIEYAPNSIKVRSGTFGTLRDVNEHLKSVKRCVLVPQ